ncbi:MAG TPA: phosphate ABC transporter permease PstA [bacterium]|jgi:phosphate transport system permease protein|nr:phosphate ABC transporter permease PstA [bacterium]
MAENLFKVDVKRARIDRLMRGLCWAGLAVALVPLLSLLFMVITRGWHRLDLDFFMHLPRPVGIPGGGMSNALVGSIELVAIASVIGMPIGVLAGIFLAEYGDNRFAKTVRFYADVLSGVPSIVTGIFAYQLVVKPMHGFSGLAGGFALSLMMIPLIARITEEVVRLVPTGLREAALALGVPRWRSIVSVVVRTAMSGIATGLLLAATRVASETAPLLFTAFNNQFWPSGLNQPTASLTVQIFTYAISPYQEWQDVAWTGALVLLMMVLLASLASRLTVSKNRQIQL